MPGREGGRDGMGVRAWMGAWAGPGRCGGRARSYIKKCVRIGQNAVSELNTEGKIRYFLPDFWREVPDISLVFPDFSRGRNPANSRGKSSAITGFKTCTSCTSSTHSIYG